MPSKVAYFTAIIFSTANWPKTSPNIKLCFIKMAHRTTYLQWLWLWLLRSCALRDHPYITSAHFRAFSDQSYVGINSTESVWTSAKVAIFLNPPSPFCWRNIGMAPTWKKQRTQCEIRYARASLIVSSHTAGQWLFFNRCAVSLHLGDTLVRGVLKKW